MSQNARVGRRIRVAPVVGNITIQRPVLQAQDIGSWQSAVNAARSNLKPLRRLLHLLYDNLKLDGHHATVLQTRTVDVTNKRIAWVVNGAPEEECHEEVEHAVINTPWFYRFLEGAMSQVAYGSTVLELVMKAGEVCDVEVVPRANVVPEEGLILYDVGNTSEGILYRDDPYWSRYLIPVGHRLDYGLMMIAAPYIIYKRGGFQSWAQFMELFGQPIRKGTYNQYDDDSRRKLFDALTNMGGAGVIVVPEGSNVEFIEARNGQGNGGAVFDTNIDRCNTEISKIYLGQTLTTESGDKGARSLGEVHADTLEAITMADMRRLQFLLNYELRPRLVQLGYPLANGEFRFVDTTAMPLDKRITVDVQVAKQVRVPEEYWYKTYGIAMPKDGNYKPDVPPAAPLPGKQKAEEEEGETGDEDKKEKKPIGFRPEGIEKKKASHQLRAELEQLYAPCKKCGGHQITAAAGDEADLARDPIWQAITQGIHDGRIKPGDVDEDLLNWTANELTKAVMGGHMEEGGQQAPGLDPETQAFIRHNLFVFSGFKTEKTLRAAADELLDAEGNIRPFADFKNRILAIDQEYNVNYLRAEYEQAVASAQMASQWQRYQATKEELPFLRYDTAGDDRVRPAHAALDGVIKPIDDTFWNTWYPPNGWRCRCDVSQVASDKGGTQVDTNELAPMAGMFANNVGKSGILFPQGHPYMAATPEVAANVHAAAGKAEAAWALRHLLQEGTDKALLRKGRRQWKAEAANSAKWHNRGAGYDADFKQRVRPTYSAPQVEAVQALTGNGYQAFNMHLRGIRTNPVVEPQIKLIRSALAQAPAKVDMLVYRDLTDTYAETFLQEVIRRGEGEYIKLPGFQSTSIDPGVITIIKPGMAHKVAMRIHVPAGTPAAYIRDISLLPAEFEVLLDHGLRARILGVEEMGRITVVDLVIVP